MGHANFDQTTQYYIQLHDLVEVLHNGNWWIAIISCLKNQETGKYMVSLPFSRKLIEIEPAQIRPCKIPPQTQESEMYRIGDMVEACQERQAYGLSWFPATVEKIIRGDYFLIKYDNVEKTPNGHLTEILVSDFLRPSVHLFPRPDHEIGMFSQVEVFYQGGWSPGMVTRVFCEGDHFDVRFKTNDTFFCEGAHLRLRWEWSGTDWTECATHSGLKSLKRKESSSDEVARTELEGKMHQTSENSVQPTNMRRNNGSSDEVARTELEGKMDQTSENSVRPTNMRRNNGSDDDNCDSRNLTRYSDEFQTKEINGGNLKVYRRRMMKRSTRGDTMRLGIHKSNHSPNDSPECASNSVGSNIILPFEKVLSQWKDLEDCNIFKSTPQEPHFTRLRSVWSGYAEDMFECVAYGLVLNFVQQVNKIEKLSVRDDVTSFEAKLTFFEEDGFVVDPIRAHLNELVKTKSAVEDKLLKRMEWGRELVEVEEDNKNVVESLNHTEKELSQLRYKMEKLQRKRKGLFDRSTNSRERISSLENKISEEDEFLDNLDRYLPRPRWNNQ